MKNTLLLIFFILTPFIHIFKLHFGNLATYEIYIFLYILIFIFSIDYFKIKEIIFIFFNKNMNMLHLLLLNLFCIYAIHRLIYFENIYFYLLFYGGSIFFFYFFLLVNPKTFFKKYYIVLLQYYFLLLFFSIAIDYFFLFFLGNLKLSFMFSNSLPNAHLVRPLGLFGQATVNSVILLFLHALISKETIVARNKYIYLILLIVGIIFQASGVGIFLLILYIIYLSKKRMYSIFTIVVFILFIIFISHEYLYEIEYLQNSSDFYKLLVAFLRRFTVEYLYYTVMTFYKEILLYLDSVNSFWQLFFGFPACINLKIGEFSLLKLIYKLGIVYFVLYFVFLCQLFYKSRDMEHRIALVLIFVGSFHYEAMFWSYFMVFLWSFVYYDILFYNDYDGFNAKKDI